MKKTILHYDMDCYYAQVMAKYDRSLLGKPVVIGAKPNERGVVATCSYEAREYGISSGMSSRQAYKRCPQAIFLHPDIDKIIFETKKIKKIARSFSDRCEFIALDEAYIDITNTKHLFFGGKLMSIANNFKDMVFRATKLECSVGMGYNKFSAKIASQLNKPNGYANFTQKDEFIKFIENKPCDYIYGIGENIHKSLKKISVNTVKDIRICGEKRLKSIFGVYGKYLYDLAMGEDDREIEDYIQEKGIGNSRTLFKNIFGKKQIKKAVIPVLKEACYRLKKKRKYARTITLRIKYSDMSSITRSQTVDCALNSIVKIYTVICKIIDKKVKDYNDVRLVGIRFSNLIDEPVRQLNIFMTPKKFKQQKKLERLNEVIFSLRQKYGYNIVSDPFDHLIKNTQFAYSITKYFSDK